MAHEKLVQSKLLVANKNNRIQTIDLHVGFVAAGLLADSRHLATRAREEAENYKDLYKLPIPAKVLYFVFRCLYAVYYLYSGYVIFYLYSGNMYLIYIICNFCLYYLVSCLFSCILCYLLLFCSFRLLTFHR